MLHSYAAALVKHVQHVMHLLIHHKMIINFGLLIHHNMVICGTKQAETKDTTHKYHVQDRSSRKAHVGWMCVSENNLCYIIHSEQSVCDEKRLDSPQLMGCLNVPRPVEGPCRVSAHHVIEVLKQLGFLCSFGVLQEQQSFVPS